MTRQYRRSRTHFGDLQLLENPVSIDEFRDFVKVSRTGSITRLDDGQEAELERLVSAAGLGEPVQGFCPRFSEITRFADRLLVDGDDGLRADRYSLRAFAEAFAAGGFQDAGW